MASSSRIRASNMTPFEDEALCRSYVRISTNSITGNSQPGKRFWSTIEDEYNKQPGITIKRVGSSLQTRYSTISQAVMLYTSKIAQVYGGTHASGTNEVDWINNARHAFQQETGKPFMFDGCYQILKELPKFDFNLTRLNTQRWNSEGSQSDSPSTPTTPIGNLDLNDNSPVDIESPCDRPPGRKAEKARKKSRVSRASSENTLLVESVDKFTVEYSRNQVENRTTKQLFTNQMEELVKIRKDEIELAKEDARVKRLAEEERIMNTDISRMSQAQQQYYQLRWNEILMRRQNEHNFGPGGSSAPM